jgi:anaerobic magnesium-protoporphyrin IX monomethyl ester cyclase
MSVPIRIVPGVRRPLPLPAASAPVSSSGSATARRHHLVLVNPPPLRGRTNDRTLSGGIGVSRRLKPLEREGASIPPIDLLYTAAVAERVGARVTVVDLLLERLRGSKAERFCVDRIGAEPDTTTWVGVRLSIPSLPQDLAFANRLKDLCPGARVFAFGNVIMTTLDHWIHECRLDFVLYGEPEAFLDRVLTAADHTTVEGVIRPRDYHPALGDELFAGETNTARYERWISAQRLSGLPRPAWHLLEMHRYAPDGDMSKVGVQIQASRGCPIGCSMCPYMLLEGKPWRSNDVEAVVDEIEYLNRTYGIHRVRFRDPNFGLNSRYVHELCDAIRRRGVALEASVETSLETFDEANLRRMYEAGIRTVTTGIETTDADCMSSIGQKLSANEKLRRRIAFCQELGFHVYGTFCLGMPEESWDTVRRTWEFANQLDVESGFTTLTPYPGTPMYWRALEEGLLPRRMRYSEWNSYTATMPTYHLTRRDLELARLWARLETIIPYRRKRARERGTRVLLSFHLRHLPHHLVRQWCRAVVWYRSRSGTGPGIRPRQPSESAAPSR